MPHTEKRSSNEEIKDGAEQSAGLSSGVAGRLPTGVTAEDVLNPDELSYTYDQLPVPR